MTIRQHVFNVRHYGAKGDGTTNDSPAFQAAIDACLKNRSGKVFIPKPPNAYMLNSTINIRPPNPPGYTVDHLDMEGNLEFADIQWNGSSNSTVFKVVGIKRSNIVGVHCLIRKACDDVTAWDITDDLTSTPQIGSTGQLYFGNCFVGFDGPVVGNTQNRLTGFRLGHLGASDTSQITFEQCSVTGVDNTRNHIGWIPEHWNVLIISLITCGGTSLYRFFSSNPRSGSYSGGGGSSFAFYNCGTSDNQVDFEFTGAIAAQIFGGRYETGDRFMNVMGTSGGGNIIVDGVDVAGYDHTSLPDFQTYGDTWPNIPGIFCLIGNSGANLVFRNSMLARDRRPTAGQWGQYMFTVSPFNGMGAGTLRLQDCSINATNPCWTNLNPSASTSYRMIIEGCRGVNNSGVMQNYFLDKWITKNATATLAPLEDQIFADATTGSITLTLPAVARGLRITVKRVNTNANTVTVARGGTSLIDGATTLALAAMQVVDLYCDGTNWLVI